MQHRTNLASNNHHIWIIDTLARAYVEKLHSLRGSAQTNISLIASESFYHAERCVICVFFSISLDKHGY